MTSPSLTHHRTALDLEDLAETRCVVNLREVDVLGTNPCALVGATGSAHRQVLVRRSIAPAGELGCGDGDASVEVKPLHRFVAAQHHRGSAVGDR